MSPAGDGVLLTSQTDRVLVLTMNRPEALNALNSELVRRLRKAFEAGARDATVGSLVLTGNGRGFSAGGDITEMGRRYEAGDRDLGEELRQNYAPLVRAIRACPKPVIAAINGAAAGAGLSLALACDLRIAARDARLMVAFIRIGLVPDAGTLFFLSRLVGLGKALELALTGEPVTAEEGLRIGLVTAVVEPADLMGVAMERASRLAELPADALALTKRGLERALSLDLEQTLELEAQLQSLAARTPDHQAAVRAFIERRVAPRAGD